MGVGTIYRHFPDRHALIEVALRDQVAVLVAMVEEGLSAQNAWDGLVQVLERATTLYATNRGLRDVALGAGHDPAHVAEVRGQVGPLVARLLRRAQEQRTVRPDATLSDLLVIFLMLSDLAHHSAAVRPGAHRRYLTMFLTALRAQPGNAPLETPLTEQEAELVARRWILDDTPPAQV